MSDRLYESLAARGYLNLGNKHSVKGIGHFLHLTLITIGGKTLDNEMFSMLNYFMKLLGERMRLNILQIRETSKYEETGY